jgi:hypothetical protein
MIKQILMHAIGGIILGIALFAPFMGAL